MDIRQKLNDLNPEAKHDLADFLESIVASIAEETDEDSFSGLGARVTLAHRTLWEEYSAASSYALDCDNLDVLKELWAIVKPCIDSLKVFNAQYIGKEVE